MNIGNLIASIGGDLTQLKDSLGEARTELTRASQAMASSMKPFNDALDSISKRSMKIGKSLSMHLTAPIVGLGVGAFKMQKDFEASMTKITSLVGVAKDQVDVWSEELLRKGPQWGKAPAELADALFFVTSAGIKGAEAMNVLEMAAKASASGLGETKVVADLVTSAMNAYGKENLSAEQATDILVASVREGKAEASELAASMGAVLPIAAEMGVSFDQVGAAQAAMTRTGTDAATASTQLRGILSALLKPSKQAEDALVSMGTSSSQLRKTIKEDGLMQALSDVRQLTNVYGEEMMAQVIPNVRALAGTLDLMGSNAADNIAVFDSVSKATGSLNKAFEDTQNTLQFKWDTALAQGKTALTALGGAIQGAFLPILETLTSWLEKVTNWFLNLTEGQKKTIVIILSVVAALGPLAMALGVVTKAMRIFNLTMLANPIGLVVLAIAALTTYVVIAIRKFDEFGALMLGLLGPFGMLINMVVMFKRRWDVIRDAFSGEGIIAGLKQIGITMLDALIYPVQQLLKLVGKIPGLSIVDDWGDSIENFRKNILGIDTTPITKTKKDSKDAADALADMNAKMEEAIKAQLRLATFNYPLEDMASSIEAIGQAFDKIDWAGPALQMNTFETGLSDLREGWKKVMDDYQEGLRRASVNNELFGDSFDQVSANIETTKQAIQAMIAQGFDASEPAIQMLVARLQELEAQLGGVSSGMIDWTSIAQSAAQTVGQSFLQMGQDGEIATSKLLKQILAQITGQLISQIVATVPFPANLALAAGAGLMAGKLIGKIPEFADGGIVSGPQLAMVGEYPGARANPEVIAPLDKLRGIIGPGGGGQVLTARISKGDLLFILEDAQKELTQTF